ncbi:hypothetical protein ElyMa_000986800 [Elysia marginata]|uniref:Uncharacterized protein n=1 Tax=Elysia marginata TaxID=1093978 RepID=A0AAV4HGA8_9GAST|nr:hypothetical protein ElyMa_000986800 [Elysia marginata]
MYVYVVSYVMYVDLKPFKGVSTKDIIDNDANKHNAIRYSIVPKHCYGDEKGVDFRPGYGDDTRQFPITKQKGQYGIDRFRVSWHMNIPTLFLSNIYGNASRGDLTVKLINLKACLTWNITAEALKKDMI